ncbi:YafY family protein [Motiliproteus sp. MSK22-1]|uniref:helix-turn-helix transcriptional regulator n=1 Tax=Motiliproteus sp. MSK22-1 TaxID=1897630 RepID=UPI0009763985|nr:WYL domain-containing protein [Motiliproteus sp. MSK22-1]OMH28071.1 WYL domain-containing protein [Motiliproteus sp. MSK22-1]
MQQPELQELSQTQRERLFHIDFRLYFLGTVNRNDLVSRFGIKEAAATRDIAAYKNHKPGNIVYDSKLKSYFKSKDFIPLFDYTAQQALSALSQGIGDDLVGTYKAMVYCDTPASLNHPSLNILADLSTAIHQGKAVQIHYCSVSSGETNREVVPFALVDNGLRWHIRGYDRKRDRFGDFVLTRITRTTVLDGVVSDHERREHDIQWNRIVEMEIVPHPNIANMPHPETIELDYGMKNGVLKINIRAAVAGYMLRRWNVDCSEDHSKKGSEFHLWLRNSPALFGVNNLAIAPGYIKDKIS